MIVPMAKVEIVGPRKQVDAITETVQTLGVLHLEEMPLSVEGAGTLHRMHLSVEQSLRHKLLTAVQNSIQPGLALVQPAARQGIAPSGETLKQIASLSPSELRRRALRTQQTARSLLRREANLRDDLEVIEKYEKLLHALHPAVEACSFSHNFDLKGILLETDAKAVRKAIRKRLQEITGGQYEWHDAKMGGGRKAAVLAVPTEHTEEVASMLWRRGVSEISFPVEFERLPLREGINAVTKRAEELPGKLQKVEEEKERFVRDNAREVMAIERVCADGLARLNELAKAVHTECVFALNGWIPQRDLGSFRSTLREQFGEATVVNELDVSRTHSTQIPVKLENNRFLKPFELLLSISSMPTYGTMDPTLLVAIGFPLFFGFVLGDAGYGIILLLISLWIRGKFRHSPLLRDVGFISLICALTTIAFGVLYGEAFGDLPHRLLHIKSPFGREKIQQTLMLVTFGIGALHILLALILGIIASIKERAVKQILERLGLLFAFFAIGLCVNMVLAIKPFVHEATVAGVVGGLAVTLIFIGHWVSLLEIVSLFANVLSYVRLFAFGMASLVLADMANGLPDKVGNVAIGMVLAVFLHLMNFVLGVLEPTIQSLRLHYVEFLPKFHNPEGRDYVPLQKQEVLG